MREIADGAYANLALPKLLRDKRISGRDAGFATELVYGATRLSGLYDAIIASAAGRPVDKIDANVLDTLRLGAHQLLGMRVPSHAAVDETVALARQVNGAGAAGFVNAVMRRISEREPDAWIDLVTEGVSDPVERLALRTSHPVWIAKALRAALIGHGAAGPADVEESLTALLESDNAAAKVSLVARPGLVSLDELEDSGAERSGLSPVGATLPEGDPGAIAAVRDGRAAVQDEGSQLLVLALAAADVEGDAAQHERWLDLCAGPGGKAGLLAALAIERRIPFVANEISEHRADLVWQTLAAARVAARDADTSLKVRHGDGRDLGELEPGGFSRVLIDAPCTGLGRAAPSPRGAVAPHGRRRRGPRGAAARAAGVRHRRDRVRRARRLRHVQPAPQRDPLRRHRHPQASRRRRARRRATALRRRERARAARASARGRTSSSGRTSTAPTRCSSPCCASCDRRPSEKRSRA